MRPATQRLLSTALLLLGTASPAFAASHTAAECREGGEFIRNAALSRDNGLPEKAFMNHLISDLSMIRGLPESVRWFARDEADESLLIRHAEHVYAQHLAPGDHEQAFVADCGRSAAKHPHTDSN